MITDAYGPTSFTSALVLKNELLHKSAAQYGFVPKLSHHGGQTSENREQSQACLSYAEVHPVFAESKTSALRA